MKLDNQTPYHAHLFRSVIAGQRMLGSLLLRVTYDIVRDRLRVAPEQAWKVSGPPWDGPYGPMPSDELFYREGVDIMVFGSARPPGGRPAPRVDVDVRVGPKFRGHLVVLGDRVWQRHGDHLVASPPLPFRAMPLDLAHAFGGSDEWDKLPIAFQDNPAGKGYYLEQDSALGQPLPNIEDPEALISRWDDRPDPVGTAATLMQFGPRLRHSFDVDPDTRNLKTLRPLLFNAAFPKMIAPAVQLGDRVSLTGVREAGSLVFHLPEAPAQARIRFGDDLHTRALPIEQIGVEPDLMRVFLSFRFPFRYTMVPLQKRACELVLAS